jgi:hypothetical protein
MGKAPVSPEWRCGLTIDVMIACAHAIDPGLPWNKGTGRPSMEVATFLGCLACNRQIRIGQRVISPCETARDGKIH